MALASGPPDAGLVRRTREIRRNGAGIRIDDERRGRRHAHKKMRNGAEFEQQRYRAHNGCIETTTRAGHGNDADAARMTVDIAMSELLRLP